MNLDEFGDYVKSRYRQEAADAMEDAGFQALAEMRDLISTPYPPSSKVGEAPHKRTGRLLETSGTVQEGEGTVIYQYVWGGNTPEHGRYGIKLENLLDRPFLTTVREDWRGKGVAYVEELMRNTL